MSTQRLCNSNRKVLSEYVPARYAALPRSSRNPSQSTADDDATELRSQDNFDRVAEMARDAYRIGKEILGELNVEDKIYEITANNSFDNANNLALVSLNSVPQSVNEAGRTGDSIKCKGIYIAFRIFANSAIASSALFRARMFVTYNHANASLVWPFPTTISATDGLWQESFRGSTLAPDAPRDYDNMDRATVIHDSHYDITLEKPEARGHVFIKHHGKTQYENDSTTINTGQYSLGFVSNAAAGATGLQVQWFSRLYFVDN